MTKRNSSAMLTLPQCHIECPPNLPMFGVNSGEVEDGFDAELISGATDSNLWLCTICKGFPRSPVGLKECPHLFCDYCISTHHKKYTEPQHPGGIRKILAPCPACRTDFAIHQIQDFVEFQPWAQHMIKNVEVRCPNITCGFKGNTFEVDAHQVYRCPMRLVECPNIGCGTVQPEYMMKAWHFEHCQYMRITCKKCMLPVLAREKENHKCLELLKKALYGIFFYIIYIILLFNNLCIDFIYVSLISYKYL